MKKILFIEDEEDQVLMLKTRVETWGYTFISAFDGEEGIRKIYAEKPDLILLDVMMPEIDGLTLLEWLREHSEKDRVPIHIVSAKAQEKDRDAALQAGADGFMAKPFTMEELKDLIARTFSNGHNRQQ